MILQQENKLSRVLEKYVVTSRSRKIKKSIENAIFESPVGLYRITSFRVAEFFPSFILRI